MNLVYCENPEVAAPSCDLAGYSTADDSALAAKLGGCAGAADCHAPGTAFTSWSLDLSESVQGALSALTMLADGSNYYLVDDVDPDCSQMLSEVSNRPIGGVRMPLTPPYWSPAEIECFRSYLHELYPPVVTE